MQAEALELSIFRQQRERVEDMTHQIKVALVGHDPKTYLPHLFPGPVRVTEVSPDEDLSDTTGTWKFKDDISPADAEEIMRQMLGEGGTLTAEDMEHEWL